MALFRWLEKKEDLPPPERRKSSRTLEEIRRAFKNRSSVKILDLGRPHESNINFYASLNAKIQYEDLISPVITRLLSPGEFQSIFDEHTFSETNTQFDLIVCWDILHYLTKEELTELSQKLLSVAAKGAMLFALISTKREVSEKPLTTKIDGNSLNIEKSTTGVLPWACYTHRDLPRVFPHWKRDTSILLRNGLEESIFLPRFELIIEKTPEIKKSEKEIETPSETISVDAVTLGS